MPECLNGQSIQLPMGCLWGRDPHMLSCSSWSQASSAFIGSMPRTLHGSSGSWLPLSPLPLPLPLKGLSAALGPAEVPLLGGASDAGATLQHRVQAQELLHTTRIGPGPGHARWTPQTTTCTCSAWLFWACACGDASCRFHWMQPPPAAAALAAAAPAAAEVAAGVAGPRPGELGAG